MNEQIHHRIEEKHESGLSLREQVAGQLLEAADPGYRAFHSRLIPGVTGLIGVRTPVLRTIAKGLLKGSWREYIAQVSDPERPAGYEEKILWALCIAGGCKRWQEAEGYVSEFVPVIDNWAVCDIFCGSLKAADKDREQAWEYIQRYFQSDREYDLRFGAVMLLSHFTEEPYVKRGLALLDQLHHEGYYAKMAAAWAVSVYFVKAREETLEYLKHSRLDDWTYNKALQKILESFRVEKEMKEEIRRMKRK